MELPVADTWEERNTIGNSSRGELVLAHYPPLYKMKGEGPPPLASCKLEMVGEDSHVDHHLPLKGKLVGKKGKKGGGVLLLFALKENTVMVGKRSNDERVGKHAPLVEGVETYVPF